MRFELTEARKLRLTNTSKNSALQDSKWAFAFGRKYVAIIDGKPVHRKLPTTSTRSGFFGKNRLRKKVNNFTPFIYEFNRNCRSPVL